MLSKKTYYIGGVILLVLLFLYYRSNKFMNQLLYDIDNMDMEQLEAFMASQGVDMEEIHRKDLESRIESADFIFNNRLEPEQIERWKIRHTDQYHYYKEKGLPNEEVLKQELAITLDTLHDLLTEDLVIKNIDIFYRSLIITYNKKLSVDSVTEFINQWITDNLSFDERIALIHKNVESRTTTYEADEDEITSLQVRNKLSNDIYLIQKNKDISFSDFTTMVEEALEEFNTYPLRTRNEENFRFIPLIAKTYHDISTILEIDITPLLIEWYSTKTERTPIPLHQLAKSSIDYIQMMKEAGLLKERERKELEKIINNDIDIFWNNNDSTLLINTLHSSLAKIRDYIYDTEDHEFFTELYYQLALNKNMNISKELNEWLYGPWVNELEEKNKLPWE